MPALIIPTTIGSIISPALVGEAPCTICMYCGSTVIAPKSAGADDHAGRDGDGGGADLEDPQRDQGVSRISSLDGR